jgi:hypothetical protein
MDLMRQILPSYLKHLNVLKKIMEMIDYIVTAKNEKVALVEFEEENVYSYSGFILKDDFPISLKNHIAEYHKMVDDGVFGVLDDIEKEIYKYDLKLERGKQRIHHILIDDNKISFYTKYPTGQGSVDHWPLRQ